MDVFLARSELISLQWLLIACCWCPLLPLFTASCGIRYNNSTTHAGEDATTCTGRFLPQVCQRICHTHGLANLASQCFVYHIYIYISLASVFWLALIARGSFFKRQEKSVTISTFKTSNMQPIYSTAMRRLSASDLEFENCQAKERCDFTRGQDAATVGIWRDRSQSDASTGAKPGGLQWLKKRETSRWCWKLL